MSHGGAGSFAGGFINAFLAAYKMRHDMERDDARDALFKAMAENQMGKNHDITAIYDKAKAGWFTGHAVGSDGSVGGGGGSTSMSASAKEVDAYTRQAAQARGMNPDVASKFLGTESSFGQAYGGDKGKDGKPSSFGPFQLHYGGINPDMPHPGMGDDFTKTTGLDARDPATWKQQIDFALDGAAKNGWGAWQTTMGKLGLGPRDGLDNAKPIGVSPYTQDASARSMPTPGEQATPIPGAPVQLAGADSGTGSGKVTQGSGGRQGVKTDADGQALPPDQQDASYEPPVDPSNPPIPPSRPQPQTASAQPPGTEIWHKGGSPSGDIEYRPKSAPDMSATAASAPTPQGAPPAATAASDPANAQAQVPFAPMPVDNQDPDAPVNTDDTSSGYARGGMVKGYADGGPVGDDDSSAAPTDDATPIPSSPDATLQPAVATDADMPSPDAQDVAYRGSQAYGPNYAKPRYHQMAMPRSSSGGHFSIPGGSSGGGRSPRVGPDSAAIHPEDVTSQSYQLPQVVDGQGGVSPGASNAIMDGLGGLMKAFGIGNSAVPNQQASQQQRGLATGQYAASPQEIEAIKKSVDPMGSLPDGLATIAGLEAVHSYYIAQGDPQGAQRIAMAMVQGSQVISAKYGVEAAKLMHSGKLGPAVAALEEGYNHIPDGKSVKGQVLANGTVQVSQFDTNGQPAGTMVANPQQVLAAALGLANGQLYYQMLSGVEKKGPTGRAPLSPEAQKAEEFATQQSGQGQGQQGAIPAQGAPAPAPAQGQPQFTPASATAPSAAPSPVPQGAPQSAPTGNAPPAAPQPSAPDVNGPSQDAAPPVPSPTPVSQPAPAPAPQGVLPSTPMAAPNNPQMDPLIAQEVQLRHHLQAQLPPMPNIVTQKPSNWTSLTPDEQNNYMRQYVKPAYDQWKVQVAQKQKENEGTIKSFMDFQRQKSLNDRTDQQATLRQQGASDLESQREQDKANAPWNVDNTALSGGEADAFTHASSVLPQAFSPPGTDPKTAASTYNQRFSPEEQEGLRDGAVSIARTSQTSPQTAARIAGGIVTPNADPSQKDVPPFKSAYDKGRGLVHVQFPNGITGSMPPDTFTRLMAIRSMQQQKETANQKQAGARDADREQTSANQKRVWDGMKANASTTGVLTGGAPSPVTPTSVPTPPGLEQLTPPQSGGMTASTPIPPPGSRAQ